VSDRTATHVHRVFNACIGAAVRTKLLGVNPIDRAEKVPSAGEGDHGIPLDDDQLRAVVRGFRTSPALFPLVCVLTFTGCRRNEALALRWGDLDMAKKTLRIERALEETKAGLRFKGPKKEAHKRTITIDDDLITVLVAQREKHQRIIAGIPDGAEVDLSLVKLPDDALMFPTTPVKGKPFSLSAPHDPRNTSKEIIRKAATLGFKGMRVHDLRGGHETALLDAGVPVHVVAARCGHDPAVLLRIYAKRTRKADVSAADAIAALSKGVLTG
jgi:integrase